MKIKNMIIPKLNFNTFNSLASKYCNIIMLKYDFEYFRITCGYVYYAISFNVQKLSGNLYLNMFALQTVDIPGSLLTIYLNNK